MSRQAAATSKIQIPSNAPTLMLGLELGAEKWKVGLPANARVVNG